MNRNLPFLGLLSVAAAGLYGCSLLRDVSLDQCASDSDCAKFGSYECSSEKVCVVRAASTGGSGNTGGSSNSGTAGSSEGGAPVVAQCSKNADCIAAHDGAPYICQEGSCVSLTLEEHCPFVVAGTDEDPTEYLTKPGKPIIFGAYVPINVGMEETHPYTLNFRFAVDEFMQGTLGGVGSPARPFVMVLCQSTNPDLEASVSHLVDTLEVPAILAALSSNNLKAVFDDVSTRTRPVFLLGTFEADNALAAADDGGRMWHMLGPATDLIPTYVPLVDAAAKYVREVVRTEDPAADPPSTLKVAVVHSDLTYSVDMANSLQTAVKINGFTLNAKENRDNYERIQIDVAGVETPDVSAAVTALTPAGAADIVISLGGPEFIDPLLISIQAGKTATTSPYYIFSPRNSFDQTLTGGTFFTPAERGFIPILSAGVNYASVEDSTLYDNYLDAIQAKYQGVDGLESRENLYDAAYFMLYALAAAAFTSSGAFDGDDVVNGMKALVDGSVPATVGPGSDGDMFVKVLTTLRAGGKVSLTGTLGPPDFNPLTGARRSPGSVWCIEKPGTVRFDRLRVVPGALPEDPPTLKLSDGETDFCYPDFFTP